MVAVAGRVGHDWYYEVRGCFDASHTEAGRFTNDDPLDDEADQRDTFSGCC